MAVVAVVMGSDSDLEALKGCVSTLDSLGVASEVRVLSAHRSPRLLQEYVKEAESKGVRVFIAAAGGAAHLPGVIAAMTTLPVIGIPIPSGVLGSLDSILSILQMPSGVPVATVAAGPAGAVNAAILAAQMVALADGEVARRLKEQKKKLEQSVAEKDRQIGRQFGRKDA